LVAWAKHSERIPLEDPIEKMGRRREDSRGSTAIVKDKFSGSAMEKTTECQPPDMGSFPPCSCDDGSGLLTPTDVKNWRKIDTELMEESPESSGGNY